MTLYDVHINREVRLVFESIEADSHEAAAAIACDKHPAAADDIDTCDGETFAAQVEVAGDEDSVTIDFEAGRLRKAAPKLLAALRDADEALLNIIDAASHGEPYDADELARLFGDVCDRSHTAIAGATAIAEDGGHP